MNLQKFYMGESFDAYEYFGAHLENQGVVFRTYAPNAEKVNIVGELFFMNLYKASFEHPSSKAILVNRIPDPSTYFMKSVIQHHQPLC